MTRYTEGEVREAIQIAGHRYAEQRIMEQLKKDTHMHNFSDADTVTVKEIREAFKRMLPTGVAVSVMAGKDLPSGFLEDIREHREFASENFKENSVVQDHDGNIWKLRDGKWGVFGWSDTVSYRTPHRPLKLLGVDKRRG